LGAFIYTPPQESFANLKIYQQQLTQEK